MIYAVIFLMVITGFIRTVNFGVWNIKDKNISGGIGLFVLAVASAVSSLINLLS